MTKLMTHAQSLSSNRIIHISEVSRGIHRDLVCSRCFQPVIALKLDSGFGFRHLGKSCDDIKVNESIYHKYAKQIIQEADKIWLPAVQSLTGDILPAEEVNIDGCIVEERLDGYRCDLIILSGDRKIGIEIKATHGTDDNKLSRIQDSKMNVFEIDISVCMKLENDKNIDTWKNVILGNTEHKYWLYHNIQAELVDKQMESMVIKYPYREFGNTNLVPCKKLKPRYYGYKDKLSYSYYAVVKEDCNNCPFKAIHCNLPYTGKLQDSYDNSIICLGDSMILDIEDTSLNILEKEKKYKSFMSAYKQYVMDGVCQNCGESMKVIKAGNGGYFYGCEHGNPYNEKGYNAKCAASKLSDHDYHNITGKHLKDIL